MPVGFQVGPLFIRFYGIILMLGAVAAAFVAEREVRRRGMNADLVWDALIWLLVGGIVGARLWHVFTPPPSMVERGITVMFYLTHPLDILTTWNGGLGLPGAVIGGLLALYLFCRRKKLNFLVWVDIAAPALALGQAIGRWGNYVNQELYGAPTSLPWRIFISPANRLPGYENVAYYHPLFLYESLWNFANFLLLMWLSRKHSEKLLPGDIFLVYLVVYPFGRFMLEFLRLDPSMVGGININQTIMLVVGVLAAATLIWRHLRRRPTANPSAA